jgi:two-component system response regulator (stage 0 sporulation protein F)
MSEKTVVLYVDDEPINLMLFELNFAKTYTVIKAESGYEGLEKLANYPDIKIVVSDMKMPGMNGIEFIRKAKNNFQSINYFILTGFEITEEIADALNEKLINKYFRKPFNMKEIEDAIKQSLEQR